MSTIQVELLNESAIRFLRELERLHLIRLSVSEQADASVPSRSADRTDASKIPSAPFDAHQLIGVLSEEAGERVLTHIQNSKDEWEHRT